MTQLEQDHGMESRRRLAAAPVISVAGGVLLVLSAFRGHGKAAREREGR